jgi:hypothetical protein
MLEAKKLTKPMPGLRKKPIPERARQAFPTTKTLRTSKRRPQKIALNITMETMLNT